MDGAIIIDGEKVVIPGVEVHTWHDHGLTFDFDHAPARIEQVRWCVMHWTASERTGLEGARIMHGSLGRRGLSVEFMITNEGTIWQFIDPVAQRGRHCSRMNPYAVGVEVSGYGWAGKLGRVPLGATTRRRVYTARVHGWKTRWYDYLPEQHRAMAGLADALVEGLGIERRVEFEPFERRSNAHLAEHGGFCGHLHGAWLTKRHPKCDPGPAPLQTLDAYFYASE